jgi:hypothetical protein
LLSVEGGVDVDGGVKSCGVGVVVEPQEGLLGFVLQSGVDVDADVDGGD